MKNKACMHQKIIDGLTYCGLSGGLACNDCLCIYCGRKMPNPEFLNKNKKTCKWCKNEF